MPITLGRHQLMELPGGARLVTAPMAERASASLVLMFGVGSRYEDDRHGGAFHFLEHLLFKGTRKRPTAQDIAEAIEGVGGVMNASTDKEVTAYWTRVPADRLELAIDVLGDVVSDSQLAPGDIDRERMVILEELKMYQDQPQDYVHSLFEQIMWPGHPLGRDIGGTAESVAGLSRDDLVACVSEHYRLDNVVVSVAGGIDSDQARSLVEERVVLGDGATSGDWNPLEGLPGDPTVLLHRKDTEQAHICLGVRAFSYRDPDRYALDLINTLLGEGMSSRLFLEIRERRGLAYDVHSYTSKHRDTGYLAVYLGVDPKKAEGAVEAVVAELRRLATEEVGGTELIKAKEFTKGRIRLGLESTNAMASWLGQQLLLMGRIRTLAEVIENVDSVTAADVQRVARRVLAGPIQLSVIGPFAGDSGFRSAIGA
ncbi:MAG: M16 family metallopeptidase [Candidatus Dormibacteraceae bacterium]